MSSGDNDALKRLAREREHREGRVAPPPPGKPRPSGAPGASRGPRERKPRDAASFATSLNAVSQSLDEFGKGLAPVKLRECLGHVRGVVSAILADRGAGKYRVVKKQPLLARLAECRKAEEVIKSIGFRTARGDDAGKQIDWFVLDHARETEASPSDVQKLERALKDIDAALKSAPTPERPSDKAARERKRELIKFHADHGRTGAKKKKRR